MRTARGAALGILLLLLAAGARSAEVEAWRSLAGFDEIYLVVDDDGASWEKYGIGRKDFLDAMADMLNWTEDLRLMDSREVPPPPDAPILVLKLERVDLPEGMRAEEGYSVTLSVHQNAVLSHDGTFIPLLRTWRRGAFVKIYSAHWRAMTKFVTKRDKHAPKLQFRGAVGRLAMAFGRDWHKARRILNGKRTPARESEEPPRSGQ